jgi:hypothetical protein
MRLSELINNFNWLTGNAADKELSPPSRLDIRALVEANGLSPQQVRAAMFLASGSNLASVARSVKVARPALSGWLHHNEDSARSTFNCSKSNAPR